MKAIFRCDATADIGFGHLSRCIALAEAFAVSGIDSVFAGRFDAAPAKQVSEAGFARIDLGTPVNSGTGEPDLQGVEAFLVVDSYRADETYLAGLRGRGRPTVVIDDFKALSAYPCDVVLNFTWAAPGLDYPSGPKLLLGPRYFPARRRLVEARPRSIGRDRSGPVRNLLIAVGGSDPARIAQRLAEALREVGSPICIRIVAANESDRTLPLDGFAAGSEVLPRQPDLSDQILWADACITGGGLIKYESAFMGVAAAAIAQNEGQAGESAQFAAAGLVFDLGLADSLSDSELGAALNHFLADDGLRDGLARRARNAFPPDPTGRAAAEILASVAG